MILLLNSYELFILLLFQHHDNWAKLYYIMLQDNFFLYLHTYSTLKVNVKRKIQRYEKTIVTYNV